MGNRKRSIPRAEASYHIAQAVAGTDRLPLSQQALHHRLQESGLLASVDQGRQMVQVRRTFEGCHCELLGAVRGRCSSLPGDGGAVGGAGLVLGAGGLALPGSQNPDGP